MAHSKTDIEAIIDIGNTRSGLRRFAPWLLVVAAVLAGGFYWWTSGGATNSNGYETEQAAIADFVVTVSATGTVEPTNLVEISSELSGTIRSVEVDYNDSVKAGQVLARLDTVKLEATLEHGRATLAAREARVSEAQATADEAREIYERTVELDRRGLVSAQDFTSTMSAIRRASASVTSAKADARVATADLKVSEADLTKARIASPIAGVILDRNADVGQIVASSLQAPVLFTVAEDLRRMELRVDVDEADIGKVEVGKKATFRVEAYQNRSFPAEIAELRYAPQTIDGVVTYTAILSIDNSELLLRPGMTATADIIVAEIAGALTVPNAALRFSPPTEVEEESGSGLLGMLITPPSVGPETQQRMGTDGRRTLWLLRDEATVSVAVMVGESDGMITEIRDGDIRAGDAVIVDLQVN